VRFFHCYKRGVDRVFVDHPLFLEKVVFLCFNLLSSINVMFILYRIEYVFRVKLTLFFGIWNLKGVGEDRIKTLWS
jgi:hypothetical protein